MRVDTPQVSWHEREPVYSLDFSPSTMRLATAGADTIIRIWNVFATPMHQKKGEPNKHIDFMSTLDEHKNNVNVVRFAPIVDDKEILASGSDDSTIILWSLLDGPPDRSSSMSTADHSFDQETWKAKGRLQGHSSDVTSISWSPDAKFIVSGEVNQTVMCWQADTCTSLFILRDHVKFVKGVVWDPRGEFFASQSCDRSCNIYKIKTDILNRMSSKKKSTSNPLPTLAHVLKSSKLSNHNAIEGDTNSHKRALFADDNLFAYFRRLTWSPDGTFLITPTGVIKQSDVDATQHCAFVWHRRNLSKPFFCLPGFDKATVAAAFSPCFYQLEAAQGTTSISVLPYRMLFAIATIDSIAVYDTEQDFPITLINGIHCTQITDVRWSRNGRCLAISSTDGFCTLVRFDANELGTMLEAQQLHDFGLTKTSSSIISSPSIITTNEKTLKSVNVSSSSKNVISDITHTSNGRIIDCTSLHSKRPASRRILFGSETSAASNEAKQRRITPMLMTEKIIVQNALSSSRAASAETALSPATSKPRRRVIPTLVCSDDGEKQKENTQ